MLETHEISMTLEIYTVLANCRYTHWEIFFFEQTSTMVFQKLPNCHDFPPSPIKERFEWGLASIGKEFRYRNCNESMFRFRAMEILEIRLIDPISPLEMYGCVESSWSIVLAVGLGWGAIMRVGGVYNILPIKNAEIQSTVSEIQGLEPNPSNPLNCLF